MGEVLLIRIKQIVVEKIYMSSAINSIRKASLSYVYCHNGGLHEGEVMNLICVDASCNNRGLVCPICRMETHEDHQILPIKVFLDKVSQLFVQTGNTNDLNNLSDYLRSLENSKKQMLTEIRKAVNDIATAFQALEQKIEENYLNLRKNVLVQSSITTKLPNLLGILCDKNEKSSEDIQQQFKKYTELLKYENQNIKVSDKAKILVESYSSLPTRIEIQLSKLTKDFIEGLNTLPIKTDDKELAKKGSPLNYLFSQENKYCDLKVEENGKTISAEECEDPSFAMVDVGMGDPDQKCTFEIIEIPSGAVSIGLGVLASFQNASFLNDGSIVDQAFCFVSTRSPIADEEIEMSEMEGNEGSFSMCEGDLIELSCESAKNKIHFLNKTTKQKKTVDMKIEQSNKSKLQLVVGLGEGDKVRIVNNA